MTPEQILFSVLALIVSLVTLAMGANTALGRMRRELVSEIKESQEKLSGEIADVRIEVTTSLDRVRTEMRDDIVAIHEVLDQQRERQTELRTVVLGIEGSPFQGLQAEVALHRSRWHEWSNWVMDASQKIGIRPPGAPR